MAIFKKVQAVALSFVLTVATLAKPANAGPSPGRAESQNQQSSNAAPAAAGTDLQELVAPIALYPDALVAQVLAGSTYPTQVTEAERWLEQNKSLKGSELAAAVDKQEWDPSIKALTQFPDVLSNMSRSLSWTSALGDAYFNDPNGVMSTIQALRRDAQTAGNLKSTSEQTVTTEGQTIVIQPASPEVVYVPSYTPEVYGAPIAAYPGYTGWGVAAASALSFGAGVALGGAWNNSWGWRGWGADWNGGSVTLNRNNFVSRSNTFANRNVANRNVANRNVANRNVANRNVRSNQANAAINRAKPSVNQLNRPANRQGFNQTNAVRDRTNAAASRGYGAADRSSAGRSSGAFGGISQGGSARRSSARGASSFSGGRAGGGRAGGGARAGGGGRSRGGGGRR